MRGRLRRWGECRRGRLRAVVVATRPRRGAARIRLDRRPFGERVHELRAEVNVGAAVGVERVVAPVPGDGKTLGDGKALTIRDAQERRERGVTRVSREVTRIRVETK